MTDLSKFIEPKSDQLNADDLIGGPRTIVVRDVKETGNKEQPISIYYEGDNGKPYKPGKSMRRVLVQAWDKKAENWPKGAAMTLYRDPTVTFGKDAVGGIRISHMSHLSQDEMEFPLMVTKGQRRPFKVRLLRSTQQQEPAALTLEDAKKALETSPDLPALQTAWRSRAMEPFRDQLQSTLDERKAALASKPANPAMDEDDDNAI
jgi:hypothetical protein